MTVPRRCGTEKSTRVTSMTATTVYESIAAARRMMNGRSVMAVVATASHIEKLSSWREVGTAAVVDCVRTTEGVVRIVKRMPAARPKTFPRQKIPNADRPVMSAPANQTAASRHTSLTAATGRIDAAWPRRARPLIMPVVSTEYTRLERPMAANKNATGDLRTTADTAATMIAETTVGHTAARNTKRTIA